MNRSVIVALVGLLSILVVAAPVSASPRLEIRHGVTLDALPRGPIGSIERLHPRDTVYIEAQAVNMGLGPATDVVADVYVNEAVIGRVAIGTLLRGQRQSISIPWWPSEEGVYTIRVVLDPENRQSRPEDRAARERVTECTVRFLPTDSPSAVTPVSATAPTAVASPLSDLKFISEIHVLPHPRNGRSSLMTVWIENGGASPSVATTVEFFVAGMRMATRSLPVVRPGQRVPVSVLWNPEQPGERHLRAVVDIENRVAEENESNNQVDRTLEIDRR